MTPWQLRHTTTVINNGGVIAYPTETVYGLGCNPLDAEAVEWICLIKNRPLSKGLILIAANIEQLSPYCQLSAAMTRKLKSTKGNPITWIVPARANCPAWLTGKYNTIAIRLTKNEIAKQLCLMTGGALVSTSANLSGQQPARSALTVQRRFSDVLDYIIKGKTRTLATPTEIRDIKTGKVIRHA